MNIDERAASDLEDLRTNLQELVRLVDDVVGNASIDSDEHMSFALLAYLSKLCEQAESIILLVPDGHGRDAELVSRSMLEAMATLLWMAQDSAVRPLQWRSFAIIHDWRLMQKRIAASEHVEKSDAESIAAGLKEHGHLHISPKQKSNPDPYYRNWRHGTTAKQIFEAVEGELLYSEVYGPASDWIHSGIESMGRAISRTKTGFAWNPPGASDCASVYATAYSSLAQCLALAADALHQPSLAAIQEHVNQFTARFNPAE